MNGVIRFVQAGLVLTIVSAGEIHWVRSAQTIGDAWLTTAVMGAILLVTGWVYGMVAATEAHARDCPYESLEVERRERERSR